MKRRNNLLVKVAEIDNLRLAFWKAGKGKRYSQEVLAYAEGLDESLLLLQSEIVSGAISVGSYNYFKIYEPKEREICASAFREQVLHHALMNVCHEDFEKKQIFNSYASRKEKGTHAALKKAHIWTKHHTWYLKMDVKQFFASIHHDVLNHQLNQVFKDKKLLSIFQKIIASYSASNNRGLPIGNLTSQYFANHYLCELDHFIKENLRVRPYIRYMDDMVLWSNHKNDLVVYKNAIENFINEKLYCQLKPVQLNRTIEGLPFLGFCLFPNSIRLLQQSKRRYIRKIFKVEKDWYNSKISEEEAQRKIATLTDFINQAKSLNFKKGLFIKKGRHHRALTV